MEAIILASIFANTVITLSIWSCHNLDMRRMEEDIKGIKKQEDERRSEHKEICDKIYEAQKELSREHQNIKNKMI